MGITATAGLGFIIQQLPQSNRRLTTETQVTLGRCTTVHSQGCNRPPNLVPCLSWQNLGNGSYWTQEEEARGQEQGLPCLGRTRGLAGQSGRPAGQRGLSATGHRC